jgi:dTDP-L-rhamnose 4-epimerase
VIFEDGMQLRDYVHVSDVVAANLLVLENSHADWETFNVGSGLANSVLDYARVMLHRMNSRLSPEIPGIYRRGDARHNVSSIAKMESLGWKTTKGLSEIFDDYLAWLQATPDSEDYATPAFAAMQRAGVLRFVVQAKASSARV